MTRLSMEQISRENNNGEVSSVTSLQLTHRALSDVSCLSNFQNLEKLDLSYNCLTSLEGLSACVNLKWLQVCENKLATLRGIERLSKLTVLNAGRNKLEKMDEISGLTNLRALILNDNNISSICKLDQMKYLNTLVLSRNQIRVIGNSLEKVKSMIKLSLSHCKLETIGSSLAACVDLKEARFSHNAITALPEELAKNARLRTLDVGNNLIEKLSETKVLSALHNLKNLNIAGNPIAESDKLLKKVRRLVPNLRTFNGKPTDSSNSSVKASEKGSVQPTKADSSLETSFSVEGRIKRNKREFEGDDAGRRKELTFVEETIVDDNLFGNSTAIGPERKKKSKNSLADVDVSETKISKNSINRYNSTPSSAIGDTLVLKDSKKKKSRANTEFLEKDTNVQASNSAMEESIGKKVKHKTKRKSSGVEAGAVFEEFDNAEIPFTDLIHSGKTVEDLEKEKGRETRAAKLLDGVVVKHGKKMKRLKSTDSVLQALFSSKHEIGMGGISTWDA